MKYVVALALLGVVYFATTVTAQNPEPALAIHDAALPVPAEHVSPQFAAFVEPTLVRNKRQFGYGGYGGGRGFGGGYGGGYGRGFGGGYGGRGFGGGGYGYGGYGR